MRKPKKTKRIYAVDRAEKDKEYNRIREYQKNIKAGKEKTAQKIFKKKLQQYQQSSNEGYGYEAMVSTITPNLKINKQENSNANKSIRIINQNTDDAIAYWLGNAIYGSKDMSLIFFEKNVYALDINKYNYIIPDTFLNASIYKLSEFFDNNANSPIINDVSTKTMKMIGFFRSLKIGDKIALRAPWSETEIIAIGTVLDNFASGYFYDEELGHSIPVEWERVRYNIDFIENKFKKALNKIKGKNIKFIFNNSLSDFKVNEKFNKIRDNEFTSNHNVMGHNSKRDEIADSILKERIGRLAMSPDNNTNVYILDSHHDVSLQLQELCNNIIIQSIIIACGYAFASGLSMIRDILEKSIFSGKSVKLLIGSLQKYNDCIEHHDRLLTGIDKRTSLLLNRYREETNFSLHTCESRFFHGKFYLFIGAERSVIIVGSSNISRSAFMSNYELNIAFEVSNESSIFIEFLRWSDELMRHSVKIERLDESVFCENELSIEAKIIKNLALANIQQRIDQLTNEEVQYRLNLWMQREPDMVFDDLLVSALPNYIAFVYNKHNLLVLESFSAGNSYFCINFEDSFENEINKISTLSKTEIFHHSNMCKRGYHASKITLEKSIASYFKSK